MKRTRLWTGLSSLFTFFLIFAIMGMNCMMSYEGTVNSALGIRTSSVVNEDDDGDYTYFESEYGELNAENLQELIADTYEQAVTEQEEGSVLLRNENDALPLSDGEMGVTLFGHAVADPLYKNASAGSKGYEGEYCIDLYTALSSAGFAINDTLYDAYTASDTLRGTGSYDFATGTTSEWSMGEEDISFYTDDLQSSWADNYNDAAIVMFAREGGEGMELEMDLAEGGGSQLALQQDEKDLLDMITGSGKFNKVIVLINSGNPMELGWLEEYEIDACLWIGLPGQRGFEGVANLLTGAANPSGKLTDTYALDSFSAPATVNGSYNNQIWTNLDEVEKLSTEEIDDITYYTVQAESIYVGYKYYETRYEDVILDQGQAAAAAGSTTGQPWNYTEEVLYPFGYGISYSSYEQTLENVEVGEDTITVTVKVENTGDVAGKSVVQVYAQTPYGTYEKENLVEKSAIQLLDFGKTGVLNPGESETLTIECEKYLLASYDYQNTEGYIMSEGDYYIAIGEDAHDALNNVLAAKGAEGMVDTAGEAADGAAEKTYLWQESFDDSTYQYSMYSEEEVTNQFADADINYWVDDAVTYLTRSDWEGTYPTEAVQVAATEEMIEVLNGEYYQKPDDAPSTSEFVQGENQNMPLAAMIGLDYDDEQWETYLNQFTIEELASMTADNFGTVEITSVGKPAIVVGDGPDGVGGTFDAETYDDDRNDTCFPCELILASTFNKDLLERRGELMGEESMYLGFSQVWMPGSNLHRTPFGGRNFEYYSEDATMNYLCTVPEIKGMASKGVHAGIKHLVANDQENNREGISTFFTEQAFREGALRAIEGALGKAEGSAVMHSLNRIGLVWVSSSPQLCTQVVRNEWGFIGQQETDAIATAEGYKTHFTSSLAAGTDTFCLDFMGASSSAIQSQIQDNDDGNMLLLLREAVHNYLYIIANSSIMNGYSVDSKVVSITPWWQPVMYAVIAAFAILEIVSLVMLVRRKRNISGERKEETQV